MKVVTPWHLGRTQPYPDRTDPKPTQPAVPDDLSALDELMPPEWTESGGADEDWGVVPPGWK